MTKDELIAKQQLEIEELKVKISFLVETVGNAKGYLYRPEQWNPRCEDFPRVAMHGIVSALRELDGI